MKTIFTLLISLVLPATAYSMEEGVFLDPETGDYRVRFLDDVEGTGGAAMLEGIFYPSTKIDPATQLKFVVAPDGHIHYRYKVWNDKASKQDIEQLIVYVSSVAPAGQVTPPGWSGSIAANTAGTGQIVSWASRMTREGMDEVMDMNDSRWRQPAMKGVAPGGRPAEFAIKSADLPGVGTIRYRGAAPVTMLPGEGPDPKSAVGSALHALEQNDFVARLAAVPKIPVAADFDTATVLTSLRAHVKGDMANMKLVHSTLVAQLDRGLQAAIEAAKRGNTDSLRAELKNCRQLLKQEYGDLDDESSVEHDDSKKGTNKRINRLAARVLDFDIKYVLKQIGPQERDK